MGALQIVPELDDRGADDACGPVLAAGVVRVTELVHVMRVPREAYAEEARLAPVATEDAVRLEVGHIRRRAPLIWQVHL